MAKIEAGFPGERFVVLPQAFIDLMADNPLTGDLFIHSLGHIAHAQHHHVEHAQGIDGCVFLYCTWGRGKVRVAGWDLVLATNQYIVLPAGVAHSYTADANDPWTLYWIVFSGDKARIFAKGMDEPRDIPPAINSRIEQRIELFEAMYATLCGGISIEKLNYANLVLGYFLGSLLYIDLFRESAVTAKHAEGMVSKVTHFMNENLERNMALKEIASFAGYSESYFYRKFIKETGHAPIDYFIHMKINKASVYLIKTSMTIAQISAKLGFNSPDYFSRTFKRIVGITATEFRKQNFRL